jgi:hypothetical protein
VACPFFAPSVRLPAGSTFPAPRQPLGDPYAGLCHAVPSAPFEPPEPVLRRFCNCGYARGLCRHFPDSHPADAVRFSVTADHENDHVKLVYIIEQYHAPLEYGPLEYAGGIWVGLEPSEPLASQARAFAENYLSRRASTSEG